MKQQALALVIGVTVIGCGVTVAQAQSDITGQVSSEDLAKGKKLYEGHCALCHGITGTGGKGPSLAQPTLRRAPDNASLAEVIRNGIENSEMPGFWQLTDREIVLVAAYVRSLGRITPVQLKGDTSRGDGKQYVAVAAGRAIFVFGL